MPVTGRLRDTARSIQARVRGFFDAPIGDDADPLELLQAALEDVERNAQPAGRGARVFPYERVLVHVRQPESRRAPIEAVFAQLEARVRDRLAEIRCEMPARVACSVSVSAPPGGEGNEPVLWIEYGVDAAVQSATNPDRRALQLVVVKGQCEHVEYSFTSAAVAIGRGSEPSDAMGRVRRNDVAFTDVRDGISETVARAHARLEFDPSLGGYVLFNESATNPTFLLRGGRSMRIAPRDPRGVRLQPGDELQLGRAILRIAG